MNEIETENMKKDWEERKKKIYILINGINFEYHKNNNIRFGNGDVNFIYEEYLHLFATMKRLKIQSVGFCTNKCKEFMEMFNNLLDQVKVIHVRKNYHCETDEEYFDVDIEMEEQD